MNHLEALQSKFEERTAVIGIVGLGYVGLPLALKFSGAGYRVVGIDINDEHVLKLNSGKSYLSTISDDEVVKGLEAGFQATPHHEAARGCDAVIICVPTPLTEHREPDLSFVINTVDALTKHIHSRQIISLESTTYPGTTEEEIWPRLAAMGLTVGQDIFLVFSPEREDPGNKNYNTATIPKIVGGATSSCLEAGLLLYKNVIKTLVPVSSTRTAEFTKLLENIHRAVNVGLVNEMKIVADRMGIDIHEAIRAASTKPFGFTPYYPGPGLGGHCIPIDPFYLTWKAREYGLNTRFIELAGEINTSMPGWVVAKVQDALNKQGKAMSSSYVMVLGIAYKKNVNDMRESPSVEMLRLLREKEVSVAYSDPYIPEFPALRRYPEFHGFQSTPLLADILSAMDCVLLATNHDAFDYDLILESSKLIVDTRGVYTGKHKNVVKA